MNKLNKIEVFYQAPGLTEVQHLQVDGGGPVSALKRLLREKHPELPEEFLLYTEDLETPLPDEARLDEHSKSNSLTLHATKCHRVAVTVKFNGKPATQEFGPGVPIARIKRWAAELFGVAPEQRGEMVLQVAGKDDQPTESTHVGTLAVAGCAVAFDLVPRQRVNGGAL